MIRRPLAGTSIASNWEYSLQVGQSTRTITLLNWAKLSWMGAASESQEVNIGAIRNPRILSSVHYEAIGR
jgi:hypothetical protein